ncbi:MAG TPA: PEP-CTERM sorting domain-containing protein, partial [Candidatus Sulfopaludibacter sp.]|nr:PEP-CTERM sorting domain-containing protein [Candidatus Sulfopaludibacter sp.]
GAELEENFAMSYASKCMRLTIASLLLLALASSAGATSYTTVDLSSIVNLGFQNPYSWFINGNQFTPILGSTLGNQGSSVPFLVANTPDATGGSGNDNFWFGLYGSPSSPLFGPPLSVTIPIGVSGVDAVYTLADNTFGLAGNTEFSITFNPVSGPSFTENYVGANNTKDYNLNCSTTGCSTTPNAQYWFVDSAGGQYLQVQQWILPQNTDLASITLTQVDGSDGAIVAGITLASGVPEPSTYGLAGGALICLALLRRR